MSDQNQFEQFMERDLQRPLPQNPMARVRTLAKELAEGAASAYWPTAIRTFRGVFVQSEDQQNLIRYISERWNNDYPNMSLLLNNGYLSVIENDLIIAKPAFDLLEEVEPASIFISYKRSESSAFALLVLARLKAAGFEPFLDLALQPGDDWEKGLRERIQKYEYFIALLGKETLKSEVCLREITWAAEANLTIIPVWHNGFTYQTGQWNMTFAVDRVLSKTHTIRVIEESALAYNNAIVELLNRFGVTP